MQGLDEEDPKGRGTGKAKGKKRAATEDTVDEDKLEKFEDDPEVESQPKKRKTRSRKGTVSSVAPTEGDDASSVGDVEKEESPAPIVNRKTSGRGRGRGRGTRKWKGERWDVIQKPD